MTKIILSGCNGKMGGVITDIVNGMDDCEIVCGVDVADTRRHAYPVFTAFSDINIAADVIIDFSHPSALDNQLEFALKNKIPAVLATTGYNDSAIEKNKGIISSSGIVELTVDMNDKWMTMPSLMDIGSSYADKSSLSLDGAIEMGIDKDTFKVGDIIEINKMLFNGKYIFTSIKESVKNNHAKYIATCKNTNVESNYIDLFRDKTKQENSERTYQTFITHYTQEGIKESHEVVK